MLKHAIHTTALLVTAALVCSTSISNAASSTTPPRFVLTNIGSLFGAGADARAINNQGHIVGISYQPGRGSRGFRTQPGEIIDPVTDHLGTIGVMESAALGVNELGQSSGWVQVGPFFSANETRAALFAATGSHIAAASAIGTLGGSRAVGWDVNDLGQVVGTSRLAGSTNDRAFRTAAGGSGMVDLGTLGGSQASASAINNAGQVVGSSTISSTVSRAFRTQPNQPINPATDHLGTLGGPYSAASDVNEAGWVVGTASDPQNRSRAFLTPPDRQIDASDNLGVLPGFAYSSASAVNERQMVVGNVFNTGSNASHAFFYDGVAMYDLNDIVTIQSSTGWVLTHAQDINDRGQIVGNGLFNGEFESFLLTPVPEPTAILQLVGLSIAIRPLLQRIRGTGKLPSSLSSKH